MALQFVLGRAGTGKSAHCFEAVEQWLREEGLGGSAILITPRQATQVAERQLVMRNPGRSLLGVRVVSPEWLVREVAPQLAESLDLMDGRGRRLLVALAIQEHADELRFFRGAERQPHLAARIDAALTEIEQSGATIDQISECLGSIEESSSDKLADLALIHRAYLELLGERLDRHRLDQKVIEAIDSSELVARSLVVVDGFADFSPMQRRMMVALAKRARRMKIALLLDSADGEQLFSRTRRTYQRLMAELKREQVKVEEPLVLGEVHRFASRELAAIERGFDGTGKLDPPRDDSVRIVEAANDLEEVRFAAEQIRRWQLEGVRLREIGVFCRDLQPYAEWIRPIFAEYDIPCFVDEQRSLGEHPLVRYVRAILRIQMDGWRRANMLELLKCGMSPLEPQEVDRLENFALRHGIDRRHWLESWDDLKPPAREDEEPEETAQRLRDEREAEVCSGYRDRAVDAIRPVRDTWEQGERIPVKALTQALREIVESKCVVRRLKELSDGSSVEEKQTNEECVKAIHEVLQACELLLGDRKLPRRHLAEILLATLEELSVKLAPPTLDQVLVAQIDRSRSPNFTRAIVLGMNEGTFPAKSAEDSMFSDAERKALDAAGIELNPDSEDRAVGEQLLGYIALTRASHELVLTRPRNDESGRKLAPSGFIARVQSILPGLAAVQASVVPNPEAKVWHVEALEYENEPKLDPQVARELLGEELYCSPTRLELFAQCPFRHFLDRSLRLKEREIAEVSHLDLGNAFHAVLERLARRMIDKKLTWDSEELTESLDEMIEKVASELRGQVMLGTARNRHLREVIKRMLEKLIADQRLLDDGGYEVDACEVVFGEDAQYPPLEIRTPRGRTVRLRGRIDRIDRRTGDGVESYLIFDYKSSARKLYLQELEQGISLQLMVYWLVMQQAKRQVDGAFYMQLMRPMETVKAPEPPDPEKVRCRPRGLIDFSAKDRLDPGVEKSSKRFSLFVKKDSGELGNEHSTDAVMPADLRALQELVRQKIGELADRIFDGEISILPYEMGTRTPCPHCPYRAVCRFDKRYNSYNTIAPARRTDVLDRVNPARKQPKVEAKPSRRRGKVNA